MNSVPMPDEVLRPDITDDAVLGGRLRLLQPRRGHRFGHDAILLAAATEAFPGELAVDLGAGVGAAGLALAHRVPDLRVALLDIDPGLVALAAENAYRNGLVDRVRAVTLDITAPAPAFAAAGLGDGCAARVLMNPPFNDPTRTQASHDPRRRLAHSASPETIAEWVHVAARLLASGGVLTMILRADGLEGVTIALTERLAIDAILPIRPRPSAAPIRVIVRVIKNVPGRGALLPGLDLNDEEGRPTSAAEAVLRHGAALPVGPP